MIWWVIGVPIALFVALYLVLYLINPEGMRHAQAEANKAAERRQAEKERVKREWRS